MPYGLPQLVQQMCALTNVYLKMYVINFHAKILDILNKLWHVVPEHV